MTPSSVLSPFAQKLKTAFEGYVIGIGDRWEQVAKLAAAELPIRCTECHELEHQPHLPDCHRHGKVTIDADHRFGGKALQTLMEQCRINQALTLEVERLRGIIKTAPHDNRCSYVRLKGPDKCDCWQRDIRLEAPSAVPAKMHSVDSIEWPDPLEDEERRL